MQNHPAREKDDPNNESVGNANKNHNATSKQNKSEYANMYSLSAMLERKKERYSDSKNFLKPDDPMNTLAKLLTEIRGSYIAHIGIKQKKQEGIPLPIEIKVFYLLLQMIELLFYLLAEEVGVTELELGSEYE